jgi:hypothetical protein
MSQAISIDTTPLQQLDSALEEIVKLGRRTPGELIRRAMADVLLGASALNAERTGGVAYSGLFGEYLETAPQAGVITADRAADDWRVSRDSKDTRSAVARADEILGGKHSGIFQVRHGTSGQLLDPRRVYAVFSKRKGVEQKALGGRAKLRKGQTALGLQADMFNARERARLKAQGYVQMNRSALIAALAVAQRERSRRSTAVQFLSAAYRRVISNARNKTGAFSSDVRNKSGTKLGALQMQLAQDKAQGRLQGFLGVPARMSHRVDSVLAHVAEDRMLYLARHLQKDVRALLDGGKAQ